MLAEIVAMLEERALDRAGELDGGTALRDRVKPLTADHFVRWLPSSFRSAMTLVDDVRARRGLELDDVQDDTDPYERALRAAGLHVPEAESPGERAAMERARREQALVFRRVDARALMEVRRMAASRGPVTRGRFNAAYQRLHPVYDCATRRRRALVLTYEDRRIVATVRGPHDTEFSVSRPAGTDERAVIAALLHRIEIVVPRSARRPKARAVDRTPKNTKATLEPRVDVDALAQEPGADGAVTTGVGEPEAIVDVMREIEQFVSRLFEGLKREATDATPGVEGQEADVAEPDPAVPELAEHRAGRPPPDTSAPLPTLASSEASPLTLASSEASPTAAEVSAPPTGEAQVPPQGPTPRRPPPARRAAIAHRADLWRARRGCPRGLGISRQARSSTRARHHGGGQAWWGRAPPSPRGYARMGPRNRGPPLRCWH